MTGSRWFNSKWVRVLMLISIPVIVSLLLTTATAETTSAATTAVNWGKPIGAGLAIGGAGAGAGVAVGVAGAAGISVLAEKREMFGTVLLILALGEGIAIYGLIIAILLIVH